MACPRNFAVDPAALPEDGLRRAVVEGTRPAAYRSMALAAARAEGMTEFRGRQA